MKRTLKQTLAIMLAVVMMVCATPLAGFVGLEMPDFSLLFAKKAEAAIDGYYSYTITDGQATINAVYSSIGGDVTIPSSLGGYPVRNIADNAFGYSFDITSITIPNGVTSIGEYAFQECTSLASITIPSSVTSIGDGAFKSCTSLKSVDIPGGITSIGDFTFKYCSNLTKISFPSGLISIGNSAFVNCRSLTSIIIPDSVIGIGEFAFNGCDNLSSVTISNRATNIDYAAFSHCTSLISITIPDSVTNIGRSAFSHCTSLKNVIVGNNVVSIGDNAFAECKNIVRINIPDSVTNIDEYAFSDCNSLKNITFAKNSQLTSIGKCAFYNCNSLTSIAIPDSVSNISDSVFGGCNSLTSITVDEANKYYSSDEYGALFNKERTVVIQYPIGNGRTIYTIPEGVTIIGNEAFQECTNLTRITIPSSVTSIGERAFISCKSLSVIVIPDSVTIIGENAFSHCTGLTCVTFGKNSNLISISDLAFWDCDILTSITIPESVTSIGDGAFSDCVSLADVYYTGTQEQWNDVIIGENNYRLINSTIHYNSDGIDIPEVDIPEIDDPDDNFYFYTLHGFSSEPILHLGKADRINMQFELEAYDGVNPSFLVSNPAFSFTSSDTNVFQIDDIVKNGNSTSIEITSENAGVAILTVTAYIDGEYVAGGQYRVTVEGETVYHAKNVPVRDDFNFISNEITVDNFKFEDHGTGYCSISFDAYNQANCIGSVDVYDKDGNLLFSKAISAFTGNLPTGLWDTVKQLYEIFTEDFYRERSYKEEIYSKKTEISLYQIPIDGYISISNDVNSSMPCALYNISKLFVKISSEVLGAFFKSSPSEEVIDEAAESLALEVLAEVIKSPVDAGTIFDILEEFCLALSHGSSSKEMDAVVDEYILFVDALNIDVGDILIEAAKDAGIGVVEDLVYKTLGVPGALIKTSFKMFSLSKTAEHIETLNEFTDSGKTSIYVSSAYDSTLYSNGYYVYDRELFDENVTFHQYSITSGNDYLDSIGVFRDMEYINVIGMDLYQNGQKVQPTGTVEVAIPVPEGMSFSEILDIRVYRKEADGTFTKLECDFRNYESGYLYIKTDHFSVYCIVAEEISGITDITFSDTEFTIKPDEYIINKPILNPSNVVNVKLVWSSSDESIARVTNTGYVIGIKPGETTITVSSVDDGQSASYKVKVIDLSMSIRRPSTTTISYGDSIILHADIDLPSGYYIEWTANNSNFEWTADGKTCTISPSSSGDTTFTATVYDADRNVVSEDTQEMTSKAGFFDKIIAFFKKLFGLTKVIPQAFKGVL